jgi:thiamine biosynthesis lipoprotein
MVEKAPVESAPAARRLVHELEQRWSRFLPTSEISWLNQAAGRPCMASEPTVELLRRALHASVNTDGLFDPFMLDELVDFGYDSRFAEAPQLPELRRGDAGLHAFEHPVTVVELAGGLRFDPGGIGKGYAADLAAERAVELGAESVVVVLGGDVRLAGTNPTTGIEIEVKDPFDPDQVIATVRTDAGAVATSSTLRRRWRDSDGEQRHHLLDPRTRRPAATDLVAVTVVAGETWWAEALAKAAVIAGSSDRAALLRRHRATGLFVDTEGVLRVIGDERQMVAT